MTKNDISELGRIAGKLEGKVFVDAFQVSARGQEWCLKFDGADVDVSIRPGEYNPTERILNEIRDHLASSRGRRS
ncbi:MAG TPA: hypothetical protein VFO86_13210 [Terriglobia bacterium]|nr:hypothetical protein [Terriglobia bacterium]